MSVRICAWAVMAAAACLYLAAAQRQQQGGGRGGGQGGFGGGRGGGFGPDYDTEDSRDYTDPYSREEAQENSQRDPNPFRTSFQGRRPGGSRWRGEDDEFDVGVDDDPPRQEEGNTIMGGASDDRFFGGGRSGAGRPFVPQTTTRPPFRRFQDPFEDRLRTTTTTFSTTTTRSTTTRWTTPSTTTTPFSRRFDQFRTSPTTSTSTSTTESTTTPLDDEPYRRRGQDPANRNQQLPGSRSTTTPQPFVPNLRHRPQVDEFGNPLSDIRSVDTTRFELGEGVRADELKCPRNWEMFKDSCYKFTRSPLKRWDDARLICQAYRHQDQDHADLASIGSLEEHRYIEETLNLIDPQHRRWYISTRQEDQNRWINLGDGTNMLNLQEYFLSPSEWGESAIADYKKDFLVYSYSYTESRWGFQPVFGHEEYLYICEMPIQEVSYLMTDERTHEYGQPIGDPRFYPMGPFFIRQPNQTVFNVGSRKVNNDVSLLCIATGWPTPTYRWFREIYRNDTLLAEEVDPLKDQRVTITGGQLIVNDPNPVSDRGKYFCTATNKFGTIRSRSVSIAFGFIGEFLLRRSKEVGSENWGKAINCDPPQYFPEVKFYWARDYFPNFVEEDRRVMVSSDGYLYFSALEKIDGGNYSCSVQSPVGSNGRNGPFFQLEVSPHPNWQQLRFPQNFPKAFPEAPVAGEDVRLECIAFGYPVPHYNWTRKNGNLPEETIATNYNRVLILPRVRVEDQGEYVCRAYNDKVSISGSVVLSIQSRPVFTISIGDMHVDEKDDVTWTCEAFGIPDVYYAWLKNGRLIPKNESLLAPEDRGRYEVRDNVLIIRGVRRNRDEGMYQCMAYNELDARYSSGQLRVLAFPPTFTKYPLEEKTYAAEGGNVTMRCTPEGAPQPKFIWRKDGNRLATGGKYTIFDNGNIFIRMVNAADTGVYTCEAANEYGKAESTGKLIVKQGPTFNGGVKPSPRIIATTGETVELRCRAEADPLIDMAYSWRFNNLFIRFFEDEEQERVLTLKNAPGQRVDGQTWFTTLTEHQKLLTTSWWYKDSYLQYTKGTGADNKFRRGHLEGYMKIINVTYAESGSYECIVSTAVGRIIATSEVIVHSPPGPIGGVSALAMTSTSGTVVWTDGAIFGRQILFYRIEGRTDHNSTWLVLADRVQAEEITHLGARAKIHGRRQYVLRNVLSPYAAYQFRVAAYNDLGLGQWSDPSPSYNTMPDKPMRSPFNVRGGGGKTGDLVIIWDPLPKQEQNAPGVYYRVYYRRTGMDLERDFQQKTLKSLGNVGLYVVRIPRKYYYTEHEVRVQVFNDMCEEPHCQGPISDPVTIMSAEDLPQVPPTQVGARPYNSTAINITWIPIPEVREKIRGKLIGYRIKYWRQDINEVTDSQYLLSRSTEPHALIIGLQPNAYYWVRVMAYNQAGPGIESERFLERTFKLRPQKPPTAVQVYGINPSTIRVTWRYVAPTVEEEPLTGYRVRVWESDKDISEANDTIIYIGNKLEATITDLTPGKTYYLRVLAFSQGGEGKMSSPAWQFQMGDPERLSRGLAPVMAAPAVGLLASLLCAVVLAQAAMQWT